MEKASFTGIKCKEGSIKTINNNKRVPRSRSCIAMFSLAFYFVEIIFWIKNLVFLNTNYKKKCRVHHLACRNFRIVQIKWHFYNMFPKVDTILYCATIFQRQVALIYYRIRVRTRFPKAFCKRWTRYFYSCNLYKERNAAVKSFH